MTLRPLLPLAAAALLAACSGGGDAPATPAAPATVALTGRAVDGPLAGATACYDLDDDGACGPSEPRSARTAADGSFRLEVPAAEAGRHAVVVDVPADAVDADTGSAVGSAFVLRAPATGTAGAQAVFVSPLTTLVQAMVADGTARTEAEARVREMSGLALSPLADFTDTAAGDAGRAAARVARLVQLLGNHQRAELAAVVGQKDAGGTVITAADVDAEVQARLPGLLPAIAATAGEATIAQSSGPLLQALLRAAVPTLAAQGGLTAEVMRMAGTMRRLAEPAPTNPPVPVAALTSVRVTSTHEFFVRALLTSAADAVPDANGYARYYDLRLQGMPNGIDGRAVTTGWTVANSADRAGDLHWNGSAWVTCTLNQRFLSRVRDAQGRGDYDYCDGLEKGTNIRRFVDIGGDTLLNVWNTRLRNLTGAGSWSIDNTARLGTATFPAGSSLIYQTNTITETAFNYDPRASNVVQVYSAAVAAGGDARVNPALACADPQQNNTRAPAVTLETLIARSRGTPCVFAQGGVAPNLSLDPNEWWGNALVNLGDLAGFNTLPANTGNYYTTTATLMVGFAATGNGTRYYRCYRRTSDNSPRNCSLIGLGSWRIENVGDARVMRFGTPPALATRLSNERVYVERGGQVYLGAKGQVGQVVLSTRLPLGPANVLLEQLGLPRVQPITQPGTATGDRAAALATLKGVWGDADDTGAFLLRVGDNGRFFMAEAKPYLPLTNEQAGAELGWLDYDPVAQKVSALVQQDSSLTSGLSHPGANEGRVTISDTQIVGSDGSPIPRLAGDAAGLAGLWALGTADDLSVPHLAFFANGRVMFVTHDADPQCVGTAQCPPGVEFGTWAYDAATGTVTFSALQYDTNGCNGIWESCPAGSNAAAETIVITFSADKKTFSFVGGDGQTYVLYRIASR